jgi:hypothetical protein
MKRSKQPFDAGNCTAAEVILCAPAKYGGEGALLVQWARLFLLPIGRGRGHSAGHLPPAGSWVGPQERLLSVQRALSKTDGANKEPVSPPFARVGLEREANSRLCHCPLTTKSRSGRGLGDSANSDFSTRTAEPARACANPTYVPAGSQTFALGSHQGRYNTPGFLLKSGCNPYNRRVHSGGSPLRAYSGVAAFFGTRPI